MHKMCIGYRFIQGFEKMHEAWKGMSRGVNSGCGCCFIPEAGAGLHSR